VFQALAHCGRAVQAMLLCPSGLLGHAVAQVLDIEPLPALIGGAVRLSRGEQMCVYVLRKEAGLGDTLEVDARRVAARPLAVDVVAGGPVLSILSGACS
jgi:hypothetical protein